MGGLEVSPSPPLVVLGRVVIRTTLCLALGRTKRERATVFDHVDAEGQNLRFGEKAFLAGNRNAIDGDTVLVARTGRLRQSFVPRHGGALLLWPFIRCFS